MLVALPQSQKGLPRSGLQEKFWKNGALKILEKNLEHFFIEHL